MIYLSKQNLWTIRFNIIFLLAPWDYRITGN